MYAYADQNFLITCADTPKWREAVMRARDLDIATIVLSPWHFYEFGNANTERMERLLQLAEEIRPAWSLDRADIQLQEFLSVWIKIWGNPCPLFQPICTLAEAAAALHRTHPDRMARFAIRDYVGAFKPEDAANILRTSMEEQGVIAEANLVNYKRDRFNPALLSYIDQQHVAHQLARKEGYIVPIEVDQRANAILDAQPLGTMIEMFVYWGGMTLLKAYQVESVLTNQLYSTEAKLGVNRFVDRQHATMALTYCDVMITDDKDLITRCEAARQKLPFPVAAVKRGQDFIDSIADLAP
jgi:hypothetical protein